ncbi:histone-fold-containing protein [Annulohypoxylon maeteangense]|uniref:histone-fold-containing protein n=1 Tax=Annulohypoxylon maeteangense TaxID=1927788 RepID=UPI002007EF38|nr:histone-fold-containing protein [Annulohypoxylon maeteangense]KAI0882807.1 histone-fold-containing protein [Annulohypoxylon maeteangense]
MPPRKSDNARSSNVSMAQFAYDGSDADVSSNALRPAAGNTSVPSRSKPTPSIEMDSQRPSTDGAPSAEKDKEKKDSKDSSRDNVAIEDLNLPKSIITRLAKGVLPPNTQIQANAVLAMCKSATVFINHLANAANEKTLSSNKKTIMPADVFDALDDIEFEFMRERLEAEFKKFNEVQTTKRSTYRRKVAAAKRAEKAAGADPNASMVSTTSTAADATDSGAPRASKKQKPNARDDSAMDVDGDVTVETQEQSDAETEPEAEQEEDEDEENEAEEEEEEEEEDDEEGGEDDPDRLEEREPKDEQDDALDDGDSD